MWRCILRSVENRTKWHEELKNYVRQKEILTGILSACTREWRSYFYTSPGVTSVYPACICKHETKRFAQRAFFSTKASVFSRLPYCIKEHREEKSLARNYLLSPISRALTYTFYLVSSSILHSRNSLRREEKRRGNHPFSLAAENGMSSRILGFFVGIPRT